MIEYLSLFTGIAGFELGIQRAYEDISITQRKKQGRIKKNSSNTKFKQLGSKQPTCIGYSEIDKYACQVYKKHFPKHKQYGDITKIIAKDLPDFDLLVGGFPCPSFSIAGKRQGLDDTRGQLVFDIVRILRCKKPKMFLLENVKGLISHDNGKTMETICEELCKCDYAIDFEVLNSKNFGVPQNRERVFIVGKRLDTLPEGAIY